MNEPNDGSMRSLPSGKAKHRSKLRTARSPENANRRGAMKQVNCVGLQSKFTLTEKCTYLK